MSRVGFLAFLGTNYGSTLQSYALNEAIKVYGYDCEVIDCGWNKFFVSECQEPEALLRDKNINLYNKLVMYKNFHTFGIKAFNFNKKFGCMPNDAVLGDEQIAELGKYDAFVCGSDQIWSPHDFWFCAKRYLCFAPGSKCIAYAPSLGFKKIPYVFGPRLPQWAEMISSIRYLSTRENSSSNLLSRAVGRSVATVLDPTFLLTPRNWLELSPQGKFSTEITEKLASGKPYLLAYLLDAVSEKHQKYVRDIATRLDLEIVWLLGRDTSAEIIENSSRTDPAGFINLIGKAAFVCADGFHGTCFSLNFSKPFLVFKSSGFANDARLGDLLQRAGAEDRAISIDTPAEAVALNMDYAPIEERLATERENSIRWLGDALEGAAYSSGRLFELTSSEVEAQKLRCAENLQRYAQLANENNFDSYLEKLSKIDDQLVILAVRDTISPYPKVTNISANAYAALHAFGFERLGYGVGKEFWAGYIAIKYKSFVVYEQLALPGDSLATELDIMGMNIKVVSSPYKSFDVASIKIDGEEYAINRRGLNLTIFDPVHKKLVDSVAFDTWHRTIPAVRTKNCLRSFHAEVEHGISIYFKMEKYLSRLASLDDCLIIIAVKDTISTAPYPSSTTITGGILVKLKQLGLKAFGNGGDKEFHAGYIAVICNKKLHWEQLGQHGQTIKYANHLCGMDLSICSSPFDAENIASIKINGHEYALNQRGMNIVVFDLGQKMLLDSLVFDTYLMNVPCQMGAISHERRMDKIPCSVARLSEGHCTGCGVCEHICPQNAISVLEDEFGFLRRRVDTGLCNGCGLCVKRCVALNPKYENLEKPACYAAMAEDSIRMASSSGGVFTVAAKHILEHGGYVCGAALQQDISVRHEIVASYEDLNRLRGSKYMQSSVGHIFQRVKELLESGAPVLFTGMPCQVGGLKAFLGKDYPELYTIDIFCHGVPSAKIFQKYVQDAHGGKRIVRLEFKAKEPWGWHAGIKAWFEDGTTYFCSLEHDSFFLAYVQNLFNNEACAICPVNCLPRQGDWSIGDFWGINRFDPKLSDDKGTSAILVNNAKGQALAEALKGSFKVFTPVPLEIAIGGNGCIAHPYPHHKNRRQFFERFSTTKFPTLSRGCLRNRIFELDYMQMQEAVPGADMEMYCLARFAATHAQGRQIVTWIRSRHFEDALKKYFGLTVSFGVSMRQEALVPGVVESFESLRGNRDKYFLVSLDRPYDEWSYNVLSEFGYQPDRDFIYRAFKPIVLENIELAKGNYYDEYGNSVEGYDAVVNRVIFHGFANHIMLGEGMRSGRFLNFDLNAGSIIDIGSNVTFTAQSNFQFPGWGEGRLRIGDYCHFANGALFLFIAPAYAVIGAGFSSSSQLSFHSNGGRKAIVGKDCMFSHEVEVWAGDGHAIFDVKSTRPTNNDLANPGHSSNQLVIGDHVWVGKQAFILNGANIGDGSIVGARALVKKHFQNNTVAAGNPAKMVREDVAWARDGMSEDISRCGEYAHLTSSANPPITGKKVLVIGGTRFMGIHLVRRLLDLGNDVTIANRGYTDDDFGMYVKRVKLDITNPESVSHALQGMIFDVVFDNLAYDARNVDNLLSNVKCHRYVQLSSIGVYNKRLGMKEEMFNPQLHPCDLEPSQSYDEGKRKAESILAHKFKDVNAITVRIPYVTETDRLYHYCQCIITRTEMNIPNVQDCVAFVQASEVGRFLPWVAAQDISGAINFASQGAITLELLINYIGEKLHVVPQFSDKSGEPTYFNGLTFSLDLSRLQSIGWTPSNLEDWFWTLMDHYIARAKSEFKKYD